MNDNFVKLLGNDKYQEKIEDIIKNYNILIKELESKAKELLSEINIEKLFEKKWVYKNVNDIGYFSVIAVIENFLAVKNYRITIDVCIEYNIFSFRIFNRNRKNDTNFNNIIKDILPDYNENYDLDEDNSIRYKKELLEYDTVLEKIKEVIDHFNKYKKQKHGT